jgi:hypothetical protein
VPLAVRLGGSSTADLEVEDCLTGFQNPSQDWFGPSGDIRHHFPRGSANHLLWSQTGELRQLLIYAQITQVPVYQAHAEWSGAIQGL